MPEFDERTGAVAALRLNGDHACEIGAAGRRRNAGPHRHVARHGRIVRVDDRAAVRRIGDRTAVATVQGRLETGRQRFLR